MIKSFLKYNALDGSFSVLRGSGVYRNVQPTEEGYLIFYRQGTKYKLKANRIAIELGNNIIVPKDKVVLHRNLDYNDYRLQNLKLVSRKTYNEIKEARRNLTSHLKLTPHYQDMFSYLLSWRENGKDRVLVVQDIVVARRLYAKLQLKYAKILSKYCVFD